MSVGISAELGPITPETPAVEQSSNAPKAAGAEHAAIPETPAIDPVATAIEDHARATVLEAPLPPEDAANIERARVGLGSASTDATVLEHQSPEPQAETGAQEDSSLFPPGGKDFYVDLETRWQRLKQAASNVVSRVLPKR